MPSFHGIVVYEVLEDGNVLNAVYTNSSNRASPTQYNIDNEIATKKAFDNLGPVGDYACRFIETGNNTVVNCELTITRVGAVYEFVWANAGDTIFVGIGLNAGNNHISVSYTNP